MSIIESIPENITFFIPLYHRNTSNVWRHLIQNTQQELFIAAYKTSLRGKNVLSKQDAYLAHLVPSYL